MNNVVPFDQLPTADLVVDAEYQGGTLGNASDDPLAALLPVGNQGGFRYAGSPAQQAVRLVVLYTSGTNPDWPDSLDVQTGVVTYYGDNKQHGLDLHAPTRGGNLILRDAFAAAGNGAAGRAKIPPFLLFEKTGVRRDVRFRGLLAPGSPAVPVDEQLVAIWRSRDGHRFQNYRAIFTVLDVPKVSRAWIDTVLTQASPTDVPAAWATWVHSGTYAPLTAPPTTAHRSRAQQLPSTVSDGALLDVLRGHFADRPVAFEQCAAEIWRMTAPAVSSVEVTRPTRDGGRDAVGKYALGPAADPVQIEFALEAKCYAATTSVGVRDVARLISRLRHRQFGVLVTTSFVHEQAYKEVREDGHPVVILAGKDLVTILKSRGYGTPAQLLAWLNDAFPQPTS